MTVLLFLGFVTLMDAVVVALSLRYLNHRTSVGITVGLLVWLIYVGLLGYCGVTGNSTMRPPGMVFILVPVVALLVFTILRALTPAGTRFALSFPLWIVLGAQCFRVIVELFLHQLWHDGFIPRMLTFSGANVDIYAGATAPIIAWLSTRGKGGMKLAFVWNVLGLLALANVVSRAVLSAPGPLNLIHAEVPNLMFGTFPFMFIPGFFVPLAVILHVTALRIILSSSKPAVLSHDAFDGKTA